MVITGIENCKLFAIQIDESIDASKCAVLRVIARYLHKNKVEENLL